MTETKTVPRAERKEARPMEIIRAALTEFAAKGFSSTRLDDVADRAAISKGTIYLYFDNKEELFKATVRQVLGIHVKDARALATNFEGSSGELLRVVIVKIASQLENPEIRSIPPLLIGEGKRFPDLVEFYYEEIVFPAINTLRGVIRRGVERGEFRPGLAEEYPLILVGPILMTGIWNHLFSHYETIDMRTLIDAHLNTVIYGLKTGRKK